jgi:O-antigen ligase
MARGAFSSRKFVWRFWLLASFLALTFLVGGGSRADIMSLTILRPLSVLVFGVGVWALNGAQIAQFKFLFAYALSVLVITALSLVPLPPMIWSSLPGRELLSEIDRAAGLGAVWRPFAMVPSGAWNAFYALFTPLAVLVLGVQLGREERHQMLWLFLGFGILSGLLGMLQVVGAPDGLLYFYSITNNGSAVGLFSNRNHAAIYLACMFPMLAVYASTGLRTIEQARFRAWMAIGVGAAIIPLLLVTGSRGGILVGLLGIVSAALLFRRPEIVQRAKRKVAKFNLAYVFGGLAVVGLGLVTALFARARALERLLATEQSEDGRLQIWDSVARIAWKYFPAGSGFGSFAEVYQSDEPFQLLSPDYTNHAHNDWLEVSMTGGALGVFLLLTAVAAWGRQSISAWQRPDGGSSGTALARMASVLLLMFAAASVADYPLRVPSMMCVATMCAIWLADPVSMSGAIRRSETKNGGSRSESGLAGTQDS